MENRLKERLTGAAILVALVVLIVPEIFRGQPTGAGASHAPQALEGPPVRSYTIDLNAGGAQAAPPRQAAAPQQAAPPRRVVPPAAVPATGSVNAPPAHASRARVSPAARHEPAAATPVHAATTPVHAATTPVRAAATGEAGWSVQLGLFSKAANATRLAHTAHGKGFAVHVSRSTRGLYRVALVGLSDRAAALRAARRLKAAGLPAAIMGPR